MRPPDETSAPAAHPDVPREEIRFGVILNGGVSLAVWMGGAVLELDALTKSGKDDSGVYGRMLQLTACTARADVIAGTSAGGINGAALALSQVNGRAQLSDLRDIWVDQGRIEALLRQPFRGAPTSLLRGDEFFLPQLNQALTRLAVPHDVDTPGNPRPPVDLTITTTVLRGNQKVTVDSMGQRLPQSLHAARFHWRRLPSTPPAQDPFCGTHIERTAHRMALAARCTASFPVAFEPVFVPVGSRQHADPADAESMTEEQRLRPDMASCVQDWGDGGGRDRSRYVVDGGLLANTPTRAALEAVEAMPASGPVRRVMLLVYPHAPEPGPDLPDTEAESPSVAGTVGSILGALTAQGSRTFVDELERHNLAAAGRRGTRSDVLNTLERPDQLDELAGCLFPHFRLLRRWRAGRDLARQLAGMDDTGQAHPSVVEGWSFERIRRAAETAQVGWERSADGARATLGPRRLPYVPATAPTTASPGVAGTRWEWGVDGALGVAEGAADVLRRLVWVLEEGGEYTAVREARRDISELSGEIAECRKPVDDPWVGNEVLAGLEPNQSYWELRLAFYDRMMVGTDDGELQRLITVVAGRERARELRRTRSVDAAELRERDVRDALHGELVQRTSVGTTGERVRELVDAVVARLSDVIPVLHGVIDDPSRVLADASITALRDWEAVLCRDGRSIEHDLMLARLLQLEIVSTTIGDEVSTGATLPVEVVQLSAQTQNAFTRHTRSGDDKLGGMSVNRFGGFLKRSWRVNDWIWGRVDAATILGRTVLHPQRVRRAASTAQIATSDEAKVIADRVVDCLVRDFFPPEALEDNRLADLVGRARVELAEAYDPTTEVGDLPASMPALADLFAWARHLEVVPLELPTLAAAIRADGVEGANARSRGEVFLGEQEPLLTRIEELRGQEVPGRDRVDALTAFDRAGVGREPIREEVSSDLTMRTATTAAAVTATVLDSGRSGLAAVKPVTRGLRGLMMLPYWVVTALTSRAALARALALLGLSIGAVLLALSLFGVLPEEIAGPATAIGGSAVLVALAYGALRSGTMLHGLVLLTPVVPLVAYAAAQSQSTTQGAAAAKGMSTLMVVVALALGMMLLGSLPAATGSVWFALDKLASRQGLPQPERPAGRRAGGSRVGRQNALRRTRGVLRALRSLVPAALVTALVVAVALWVVDADWAAFLTFLRDNAVLLAVAAVLLLAAGALLAWRFGRLLQVLRQVSDDGDRPPWEYATLTHPAGAAAGWAVLYGALYLGLAAFLVWDPANWQETAWGKALLAMSIILGVVLGLGYPLVAPFLALRATERSEIARARTVVPFELDEHERGGLDPAVLQHRALAVDLASRGVAYRWLVSDRHGKDDPNPPSLTRRGLRLEEHIVRARTAPGDGAGSDAGTGSSTDGTGSARSGATRSEARS